MTPILKTEGLSHIYSSGTPFEITAIENINFEVERGEFIGLIGHTGSGKSTLIQHLNGLVKPFSGRVLFDGRDIWTSKQTVRDVRFHVGLVFQYPEYQLFEETVAKDIAFGPKNMRLSQEEINERVQEAAAFTGLPENLLSESPFELSGGQQRRVAIAGVIAMRPDVLILDEPTAGLDPGGCAEIIGNIINYHKATGSTVIMVTHDMDEAARCVGRMVVMDHGRIAMDGTPQEVFSRGPELAQMGLAVPVVSRVCARLRGLGVPVSASIYTVEQAAAALRALRGGGADA